MFIEFIAQVDYHGSIRLVDPSDLRAGVASPSKTGKYEYNGYQKAAGCLTVREFPAQARSSHPFSCRMQWTVPEDTDRTRNRPDCTADNADHCETKFAAHRIG